MKKFLNDPSHAVQDMFDGIEKAHPDRFRRVVERGNVFVRPGVPIPGRVGVLLGGGSGHEPMFIGYLGQGLADAVVQGGVFASPTPDPIVAGTRAVNSGAGVLHIFGNYAGDQMNFKMAAKEAKEEGIEVASVAVDDDIALGPDHKLRRGVTADVYVVKAAGAGAAAGLDLGRLAALTRKAADACRTLGVCLTPGTFPETGKPSFELGPDEMEIGMGAHGEAGIMRGKLMTSRGLADLMIGKLVEDFPLSSGDEVCLLVNGMGSTTLMELYIMASDAHDVLRRRGIRVFATDVGSFMTTQEMGGCHLTLFRLDDELKRCYLHPCESLAFNKP